MNVCPNVNKHINIHTLCKFKQVHRQFPIYKLYMSQMLDHELCEMQNTVLTGTLSLKEDRATHGPTTCFLNTQNTRTQVAAIYTMFHLKIYSQFYFLLSQALGLLIIWSPQPGGMGGENLSTCVGAPVLQTINTCWQRPQVHATKCICHPDTCDVSSNSIEILVLFPDGSQMLGTVPSIQ